MQFFPIFKSLWKNKKQHSLLAATIIGGTVLIAYAKPAQAIGSGQGFRAARNNIGKTNSAPITEKDPVTFQSNTVEYNNKTGIVTWTGDVQIWQNDNIVRADKVTYDRNTNVVAAYGHVAMIEPDGEVLFSDYTELSDNMRQAIMTRMYALLADNGKLAANGMRRTGGKVNDMTRAVYTACNICAEHPENAPFWQLRAYGATQDTEHKNIEFDDAYLDFFGIPAFYFPYFSIPDPSVKRSSGFLIPGIAFSSRYLGMYFTVPYYWAIDDESDATFTPLIATRSGPQITVNYRHRFNDGYINFLGAVAYDTRKQDGFVNGFNEAVGSQSDHGLQGFMFLNAEFSLNEEWRYGINLNLATSANYMRDYRVTGYGGSYLASSAYLEGFGTGSYSKVDVQGYQGLNYGTINDVELPYALPRYTYSYFGQPDALGGRFSFDTTDFYIYRSKGTTDQRGQVSLNWDRPFNNALGQQWMLTMHVESTLYHATHFDEQPNYGPSYGGKTSGFVQPTIALKMNWPFIRRFGANGTQIFEPIVQLIAAPNTGNSLNRYLPNEDSLAYEFTDTTLFALNRFQGTDRQDGGIRANVGIHANWRWDGREIDALVGESFQAHVQKNRIYAGGKTYDITDANSGLSHKASDIVGRVRFVPTDWLNITARSRFDPHSSKVTFGDGLINAGIPLFNVNAGYLWQPNTPYYYYARRVNNVPTSLFFQDTSEITMGVSTQIQQNDIETWHASVFSRRSLARNQFVTVGGSVGYANDCFAFDTLFLKQYTAIGGQNRNFNVLFNLTFKTIGTFGFNG
ncbi:LPS-assembly protein LptD [Entomobacter blattae]|uniref:LPS-assembly protein LptD n=1 Tax=Entomobacter blattae TaxID=2762277 RepID=A0A7H1NV11_9PROT|nr:LPS assembly protein LptD [Entomobacter blattae]QNT79621.1 LPS-assembly protein LptD [Entomobacter blattae]